MIVYSNEPCEGGALTIASCHRARPGAISQADAHPRAGENVASVASECDLAGKREVVALAIAIFWASRVATGNDCTK